MRISLTNKITIALVLFGLVPASIIAWFAWNSNNDFGNLQTILVKQAATSISDRSHVRWKPPTRRRRTAPISRTTQEKRSSC